MFSIFGSQPNSVESRLDRRRSRRGLVRLRNHRPDIEFLEVRITPTTDIWTGAVSTFWDDPGNWSINGASGVPSPGDDLDFPASGVTNFTSVNNLTDGLNYDSITIDAAGFSLLGHAIDLTNGITTTYGTGSSSFDLNATVGDGTVTVQSGGTLDILSALSGAPGLDLAGGGTLALTGIAGNSYLGTTTVDDGSTLLLSKTQSAIAIPGALDVADGTVQETESSQFAATSTVEVDSAGTLDLNDNNDTIAGLTLVGGTVTTETGVLTLAGDVTAASSATMASISGNLDLGTTTRTFDVADPAAGATDLEVAADISGSSGITKTDTGRLDLSGTNSYTGATTVSDGILSTAVSTAFTDSSGIAIAAGAELDISGGISIATPITSVQGTGTTGAGAIVNTSGTNTLSGAITLADDTTVGVNSGQLTLSGVIDDGGNVKGLTLVGGAALVLGGSAANTYTGTTTVDGGTLELSDTGGEAIAGPLVVGNGTSTVLVQETESNQINASLPVTVYQSATFDLDSNSDSIGSLSFINGGSVTTETGLLTLGGDVNYTSTSGTSVGATVSGKLDLGGHLRTFTIAQGNDSNGIDLDIPAAISGTGAEIVKAGAGTLELDGANSYDSGLIASGGLVIVENSDALGTDTADFETGSSLELIGGITVQNEVVIQGTGVSAGIPVLFSSGATNNTLQGTVLLAGDATVGADTNSTLTIAGVIDDFLSVGAALTVENALTGTTVFSGANTYSGPTEVAAGTLDVDGSGTLGNGTGAATADTSATLELSGNTTINNTALTLNGTGVGNNGALLNSSGDNSYAGTITLGSNVVIGSDAGNLDLGGDVSGTGFGLTKLGSGELQLDGTNTFDQGVTVSNGTVIVTSSAGLGTGNATVDSGASLALFFANTIANNLSIIGPGFNSQGALICDFGTNTVSGDITLTGAATIGAQPGSTLMISGVIDDGGNGYALTVNNASNGTTVFSGANTYSGTTEVAGGILDVDTAGTLGDGTGAATVDSGATLEFSSGSTITSTSLTLNGTGVGGTGALLNLSGNNTYGGAITLGSSANIGVTAGSLDLTNTISGTGFGLTEVGSGTLQLDGSNTFDGGVTVSAGTLIATSNAALGTGDSTVDSGAALDLSGGITIANNLSIAGTGVTVQGALVAINSSSDTVSGDVTLTGDTTLGATVGSTLTISGVIDDGGNGYALTVNNASNGTTVFSGANTYAGTTEVAGGILDVDTNGTLGNGTGAATIDTGATLELSGGCTIASTALTLNGTGVGGNGALLNLNGSNTYAGAITLGSNVYIGVNVGTLDLSNTIGGTGFGVTKLGAGILQLDGANTFDQGVTVSTGTVVATGDTALGSGNATVASGAALDLDGVSIANDLSIAGAGLTAQGALVAIDGTNDTVSGTVTLTAAATMGATGGSTLTISGVVGDGNSGYALTDHNALSDTTVFSGANTYAGTTEVAGGTLDVDTNGSLGSASAAVTVDSGATLELSGGSTIANTLTLNGTGVGGNGALLNLNGSNTVSGAITLGSNVNIGATAGTLTLTGAIGEATGGTTVTMVGSGTLDYAGSAANAYTGTTTVDGGTLELSDTGGVAIAGPLVVGDGTDTVLVQELQPDQIDANLAVTVNQSSTFDLDGNNDTIGSLTFTNGGSVTTGAGTLTLGGDLSYTSTSGTSVGATLSGFLDLGGSSRTFDVALGNDPDGIDLDISAAISGTSAGITKAGTGTLQLDGTSANTYTGTTAVNAGRLLLNKTAGVNAIPGTLIVGTGAGTATLQLDASDQIIDTAMVTVNEGAVFDLNGFNETIAGLTMVGATVSLPTGSTLTVGAGGIASTVPASPATSLISGPGALDLDGNASFSISVALDSSNTDVDLRISAIVQDGGVIETGGGRLALAGDNTFAATQTETINGQLVPVNLEVEAGTLQAESDEALGDSGGNTVVDSGASLVFSGTNLSIPQTIFIAGTGISNAGVLWVASGSTSLPGRLNMIGDSTFGAASGTTLTIAGFDDFYLTYNATLTNGPTGTTDFTGGLAYFGGNITATAGFLEASNLATALGNPAASSTVTIQDGASFEISGAVTLPSTKSLVLEGNPVANSSKVLNLAGNNTYDGTITLQADETVDVASGSELTVSGAIGDGGTPYGLTTSDTGTLAISGTSSYTGATFVNGGNLLIDGDSSSSSGFTVNNGGSLVGGVSGGGTAVSAVTVNSGGTVAPGFGGATAELTTSGNVSFASGSTYSAVLGGATAGTQYDQLNVNGTVDLNSDAGLGATLTLALANGYVPVPGTTYTIITSTGALSNTFDGDADGSTIMGGGYPFQINYQASAVVLTALPRIDTWTGGDGTGNWSDPLNWQGDITPATYDALVFPAGTSPAVLINDLTTGTEFTSIAIDDGGLSFTGNPIVLDSGITADCSSGSGTSTFAIPITLSASQTIEVDGGTLDISAIISGAAGITKTGVGTLELDGANTYTGDTAINAGILEMTNTDAIGASGGANVTVAAISSELLVEGTINVTPSTLTINGTGVNNAGALVLDGAITVSPGTFTLGSDSTIGAPTGSAPVFQTAIDDNSSGYSLTLVGSGTTEFDSVNSYTGMTIVEGGTLELNSSGVAIAGDLTIDASNGSSTVEDLAAEQIGDASAVALIGSGATLDVGTNTETIGALEFTGGSVISTGSGKVRLLGDVTVNSAATTATISGTLGLGAATRTFNVAQGSDPSHIDLSISALINSAVAGIIKDGAGEMELTAASNYPAGTTINAGVLAITNAGALGTGFVEVMNASELVLDLTGPNTITNDLVLDSTSQPSLENQGGDNTFSGPITIGASTDEGNPLVAYVDTASSTTLTFSGDITEYSSANGGYGLTKTGGGTLQLDGTNSYSAATIVDGGNLLIDGDSSSSSGFTVNNGGSLVGGVSGGGTAVSGVTVNSGGTVAPGFSGATAELTAAGNVSFASGSTYSVVLGGAIAGTQYDQLNVTGTVDLNSDAESGATLALALADGYIPQPGTTYTIITSTGALSNTFDGDADGSTVMAGGYPFQINYQASAVVLTALPRIDTWTGGDGTGNWSDPLNWQGDITPATYDSLVFPAGTSPAVLINDLTTGTEFTSITIDAGGLSFTGNPIVLDSGITADCSSGSGTSTFAIPITLNADQTFEVDGGTLDISAIISGSAGITEAGVGTLELDGANTYTGNTTINAGILEITSSTALGASGGSHVTVTSGAELDLGSSIVVAPSSLTIGGTGVDDAGAIVSAGGEDIFESPIMLSADTTVAATGGLLYFDSPISDCGHGYGVTLVGGGTVGYSAQNTYTGMTDVTAGDLNLSNGSGVSLAGPLTIDASSSGSATVAEYADNQLTAATANVTLIGSGATFDLNGYSDTALSLTFTGGSVTTGAGTLTIASGGTVTTNAASTTATIGGTLSLTSATTTFTVNQGGTVPGGIDLAISADISGTGAGIFETGGGEMELSGNNTYTGATTINAGTLVAASANALGATSSGTTVQSATLVVTGGITLADVPIVFSGFAPNFLSTGGDNTVPGPITLPGSNLTIAAATGTTLTLSGAIGSTSLPDVFFGAPTDPGTVVLSGNNTFSNYSEIHYGTLVAASSTALGSNANGLYRIYSGATLALQGGVSIDDSISELSGSGVDGNGVIQSLSGLNTLSGSITLVGNATIGGAGSLAISNAIGDGGYGYGLTDSVGGTLDLSGTSTYTGSTTVSAGTLEVDGNISDSSEVDVDAGATLSGGGTVPNVVVTGGTLAPADGPNTLTTGSLSLNSSSTYSVQLDGTSAGDGTTGYDQVVTSGAVNLDSDSNGGATLTLAIGGGYVPTPGDQLTIISNNSGSGVTGTFNGLPEGSDIDVDGYAFSISYVGGVGGQNVVLTAVDPTTTTLTSSTYSPVFGQSVSFTATVTANNGTPSGTVTFEDYGIPLPSSTLILSGGVATYTTSLLTVGDHSITAIYNPTGSFNTSNAGLTGNPLVVAPDATTTQISTVPQTSTYGQSVTFTAHVTANSPGGGVPGGTITFWDGTPNAMGSFPLNTTAATVDSQGYATYSTSTLHVTPSPQAIFAVYAPSTSPADYITSTSSEFDQTVTPASLTITASDVDKPYGTAIPGTFDLSYSGFQNGDDASDLTGLTVTTNAIQSSPVSGNPYSITPSGAVDPDYTYTYVPGNLTVTPVNLIITADDQTKVYGAALPTLTVSYSGFVLGETASNLTDQPVATTAATPFSPVQEGGYTINASGAIDGNYNLIYEPGTLTVTQAPLTVTADNQAKVYGAADPTLTFTATGLLNGDSPSVVTGVSLSTATGAAATAGTHTITATGGTATNYYISDVNGTLTVSQASLTVTADDQSKVYGAADPTLTFTPSGTLYYGDAYTVISGVSLSTATGAAATAGTHAITASGGTAANYAITDVNGTLTVSQASLTVTADDQSKVYGAADPTLTFTPSGTLYYSDTYAVITGVSLSTATGAAATAGTHTITATGGTATNYYISDVNGTLTVSQASLTVTANNQSKVYGAADPTLTFTPSGTLYYTDTYAVITGVSLSTATGAAATAGTHTITASGGTAANYDITDINGTLNVSQASLTVTANNQSKVYGAALPTLTASYSGFVNGDTAASLTTQPTLATTASAASHVQAGGYAITASGAVDPNYTISYAAGTMTVTPAPLTITANNQSKVYGAPIPALTASYSGFVDGDTAASLTTQPTLTTTSTSTSPVGTYPILVSGATATDYSITFHGGTLAVAQANSSATFVTTSGTSVFGQATSFTVQVNPVSPGVGAPTGVITFFVDGNAFGSAAINSSTGQATLSTTAFGTGTHTITAAYSGDTDFAASQSGSIQQVVNPSNTQPLLTARSVRNRRGKITSVILTSQIGVTAPGSGVPTGTVTYFVNGRSLATKTLTNATSTLTLKPKQALHKTFFVTYSGDSNFFGARSPKVVVNTKSLKASARPLTAFSAPGRQGHAATVAPAVRLLSKVAGFLNRFHIKGR